MKIIYCLRQDAIEQLKDKPTAHKTSKIKTKFSEPRFLCEKDFTCIENIYFLPYDKVPVFSVMYDSLMDRQLFEHNFKNLSHRQIFEDYIAANKEMSKKILEIAEPDDLVVVNDSSFLLLPTLINLRVAIRNLKFEKCFIEKLPYYKEIVESICCAQKFFNTLECLNSFNYFIFTSYEFREIEKGGCWFIKPFIRKQKIVNTLITIKRYINEHKQFQCTRGTCICSELMNCKIKIKEEEKHGPCPESLYNYLKSFIFPKNEIVVLTTANLLHLEPFIKENPDIHVKYLRTNIEVDEEFSRMAQYIKKRYQSRFTVCDPVEYSQIVAEFFYCDAFVGDQYNELASFFGKPIIADSYDAYKLKTQVLNSLRTPGCRYDVVGEEEYVSEFLKVNGYDILVSNNKNIDKTLKKLIKRVKNLMLPKRGDYYENRLASGIKEYFNLQSNSSCPVLKSSYKPILTGENCYIELKNRRKAKDLKPIDIEKVKKHWMHSNKTILLDYDGTLSPIVNDPDDAYPSTRLLQVLEKLNKTARIVICSGRSKKNLDKWIPMDLEVYGEHGAFHRLNGNWSSLCTGNEEVERVREMMDYYVKRIPGAYIEEKDAGLVLHYRKADCKVDISRLYTLLRRVAGDRIVLVKKGVEYRIGNKETVCNTIDPTICAGDDVVDEDMFRTCKGMSIRVGEGKSHADGYIEDVEGLINLLEALCE